MSGLFGDEALPPHITADSPAYRVLARKYRPADFSDLIGQEAMVRTLRNAFAIGRIAHAFMLTGVRGVGKTTTARIVARALNCVGADGRGGPTADPCGTCHNCRSILAERHPDVIEMDAASRTGVDDVRELIDAARFRPMQARAKVFIVDEVHMLSRNAFNALLKTLEEPPGHVKFIFATTEWRKVPVTVLSRCQRFDLRRVSVGELSARFARIAEQEGVSASSEALAMIARAADGSVRDGLSLLDQAIARGAGGTATGLVTDGSDIGTDLVADMLGLADRAMIFELMECVAAGQVADVLEITERAYARGADLGLVLGDLLDLSHMLTRLRSVPSLRASSDLPELDRTRGASLADRLSIPTIARLWQALLKGIAEVEAAPDRRAAAEMVLVRLCHLSDLPAPAEVIRDARRDHQVHPSSVSGSAHPPQTSSTGWRQGGSALALHLIAKEATEPPTAPMPTSFREVASLAATASEPLLSGHLQHSVHLVRFAPPILEIRPQPAAPRDLATRLGALLLAATGTRWTIAVSSAEGEPTLAAQEAERASARRESATDHPLVRAVLTAFPGAILRSINPALPDEPILGSIENPALDMPDFAPLDAEAADLTEIDL